jgi:argininosuccinate lyase
LLESFLSDLKIDVARAIHNADQSCATMTELADSLVRLEDVAFRTAHDIASSLASSLVASGRGISGLTGEEVSAAFEQAVGRKPGLSAQALKALAQVDHFIAVRDRTGGPGPNAMASSLRRQTQQLRDLREAGRHLRIQDADAAKRLHATRAELTGA